MSDVEDWELEQLFDDVDDDAGPDEQELRPKKRMTLDEMDAAKEEAVPEPSDYTQHLMLSYLIAAPELWVKCAPIIKAEYFDPEYRPVINFIKKHLKKHKDMPDTAIVMAETGVRLDEKDDANKESRQNYICDSVEEFCRTTAFNDFLVDAAETVSTDRTRGTLASLMKQAADIERISLTRNLGIEIHGGATDVLKVAEEDDNISTGFSHMDRAFSGGLTRPSFNIVSAASGDGKSIFMQNMLVNYIEMGMNCIFYTLELAPPIVIKRFAAMMTDTHIDLVYSNLDNVAHSLQTRGKTDGALYVVKFPMVGTNMSDIAAHYMELTMHTGLHFGAMAVDYLDVMDPVQKVDKANIHLKDKFVSEEMNDWAHENKVIVWSASQQTKGAQDEKDPRQSGVSGGTPKVSTCDNLIIGKRNEDDIEDERWWAHVAKARSSGATKAKIPLRWNAHTQRMSDGDPDLFEEANPKLFYRKRAPGQKKEEPTATRLANDPVAKEMGAEDMKHEVPKSGADIRADKVFQSMRGMTHQQEELRKDAETE